MECHGHTKEDSNPGKGFLERTRNRLIAESEWDLDGQNAGSGSVSDRGNEIGTNSKVLLSLVLSRL